MPKMTINKEWLEELEKIVERLFYMIKQESYRQLNSEPTTEKELRKSSKNVHTSFHDDCDCWYCEDAEYKKTHNGKSMWN